MLGGHDHIYYVGNGAASYSGDDFPRGEPGTEKDTSANGRKSGTDFRDLSELKLELTEPSSSSSAVRKRTIKSLSVKRYRASASDPTSPELKSMLDDPPCQISKSTGQSVAYTLTPWDVRSEKVRTDESAFGKLCRRRPHELFTKKSFVNVTIVASFRNVDPSTLERLTVPSFVVAV